MGTADLVASCGGSCSRQSCQPLQGDLDTMTCKNVLLNPVCNDANGNLGCTQIRVNLGRSYVRLPTTPNVTLSTAANYTICSQRMLEPLFLEISRGHNSAINLTSWFYFGSVEGVQRSFPGRDQSLDSCTFDPRKRPWYMGATAVQKDLVILLDSGNSMGDYLPNDIFQSRDFTKFTASVNMIDELLDTLTYGDRVSVISFSSSTKANMVYKTITSTGNSSDMQPLKDALSLLVVDAKAGPSSLQTGMLRANQTFTRGANTNALKIMVVITDGQFAADPTVVPALQPVLNYFSSQQVLTMLYSFDRTEPARAALSSIACSVNGSYERVNQTVLNPLWTLRSYFGTIAYWRLKAQNFKPYWSKPYQDSGSLGEVITVAYPAFAPDNYTLIGVVGSDILMTELGSTSTGFSQALAGRNTDDSVSVTSEPLPCNVQLSDLNSCPSVAAPANPICLSNDTSNVSFQERICTCPPQCKAPPSNSSTTTTVSPAVYGAAGGGGALFLLALAFLVVYCCRRRSKAMKIENQSQPVSVAVSKSPSSEQSLTSGGPKSSKSARPDGSTEAASYSVTSEPSSARSRAKSSKSVKAAAWPVGNQTLKRDLICFSMEELEDATENWSAANLVGKGACGSVYRGVLDDVNRAIKRPHPEVDVAKSTFDKELDLLSKLNHRCLVRLIGYCEDEHVLVFEYMEYGTLEDCLHGNRLGRCLTWQERLNIAAGASRGLEYLHEYATTLIIHGDVKPANILLDEKLEAHIADFGLSLSSHDQDATMLYATRMGGTPGYFDPEYASLGSFTPKSDVYSFGVVLLELFSGRKVVQEKRNITSWASEMYEGDVLQILDPQLERPQGVDSVKSIITLAIQCVQAEHRYRPKMKEVAAKLSSAAVDWHKFELEISPNEKKHPSRRQHPQYRPLSRDSDEFQDDYGH
ncbi:hypothetical protein M758_7G041500 [Ceratodon purpureus]|nr:hypothetical protein M758_7G041500 [Ceratodon purpureus]KAG0610143.1 hypothetical protein M758_7G041500 [Ceratodon purpureus]